MAERLIKFKLSLKVDTYDYEELFDAVKKGTTVDIVDFAIYDEYFKLIIDALISDDLIIKRDWDDVYPFSPVVAGGELSGSFYFPYTRKNIDASPDVTTKSVVGWRTFFMDKLGISAKGATLVFHELCNWGDSRYETEPGVYETFQECRNLFRVRPGVWRTDRTFFETRLGVVEEYIIEVKEIPKELIQYRGLLRWTSWVSRRDGAKQYNDYWTIYVWWKFPPETPDNVLSEFFEDALNEVLKQIGYHGNTSYTAGKTVKSIDESGKIRTKRERGYEYIVDAKSISEHWGNATDIEQHGDMTYERTTHIKMDGEWVQLFNKGSWPKSDMAEQIVRSSEMSGYKRVLQGGK